MRTRRPCPPAAPWLLAALLAGCAPDESGDRSDDKVDAESLGGFGAGAADDDTADDTADPTRVPTDLATAFVEGSWTMPLTEQPWEEGDFVFLVADSVAANPIFGAGDLLGGTSVGLEAGYTAGREAVQDTCVATDTLQGTLDADGQLSLGIEEGTMPLSIIGVPLHLQDVELEAVISEDGALNEVSFAASWDARRDTDALADLIGSGDWRTVCELLVGFGSTCQPCADGEEACMPLRFSGGELRPADGPVVPVDEGC